MGISVGIGNYIGNTKVQGGIIPKPKLIASYRTYDKKNSDSDRNILKDLSGNRHDIKLYNFSYDGESSGYLSRYLRDLSTDMIAEGNPTTNTSELVSGDANMVSLKVIPKSYNEYGYFLKSTVGKLKLDKYPLYLKMENNFPAEVSVCLDIQKVNEDAVISYSPNSDGIFEVNSQILDFYMSPNSKVYLGYSWKGDKYMPVQEFNVTIEQLPNSLGGLVFDGIDDYGFCDNFPILKKNKGYTVIALRKWLSLKDTTNLQRFLTNYTDSKNTAFLMESVALTRANQTASWGPTMGTNVIPNVLASDLVVYQTSYDYNGIRNIQISAEGSDIGSNQLTLGNLNGNTGAGFANMIFYAAEIYDRDLTPEEIEPIKQRMLDEWYEKSFDPSLIDYQALWTCNGKSNYDVDKNIPNLADSTNPLTLRNFAFAGNSGYNNWVLDFRGFDTVGARCELTRRFNNVNVTKILIEASNPKFEHINPTANYPSYQIKVTGLKAGATIVPTAANVGNLLTIDKDGTYTVPAVTRDAAAWYGYGINGYANNEECNINIELLPTGEFGLYLDGVDDQIVSKNALPALTSGYTVVGLLDINSMSGIYKDASWYWYMDLMFIGKSSDGISFSKNSVIGFTSEGLVITKDSSQQIPIGNDENTDFIYTGFSPSCPQMVFKSLAIIPRVLTETQIRQVYEYLKTIKAKNL